MLEISLWADSKENPREKSERVREKERRRGLSEKKNGEKDKIIILSYSECQRTTINENEILSELLPERSIFF